MILNSSGTLSTVPVLKNVALHSSNLITSLVGG